MPTPWFDFWVNFLQVAVVLAGLTVWVLGIITAWCLIMKKLGL